MADKRTKTYLQSFNILKVYKQHGCRLLQHNSHYDHCFVKVSHYLHEHVLYNSYLAFQDEYHLPKHQTMCFCIYYLIINYCPIILLCYKIVIYENLYQGKTKGHRPCSFAVFALYWMVEVLRILVDEVDHENFLVYFFEVNHCKFFGLFFVLITLNIYFSCFELLEDQCTNIC